MQLYLRPGGFALFFALASVASAQIPHVGEINLYGLRKVAADPILKASELHKGEPLPGSKGDLEERVAQVAGVRRAAVEAVCCEGKDVIVFVGIEEQDGPRVAFHPQPSGQARLPEEVSEDYRKFLTAIEQSARQKKPGEAPADAASSAVERKFAAFADVHLAELRDVLRGDREPAERATAAAVIGYAAEKTLIVGDLQYALLDPDPSVRSNAMRSLHAIAFAEKVAVAPATLVQLLNSIVLSDRTEAADVLVTLTETSNPAALAALRAHALPALAEMARWESLRYALRPYLLLGRTANFSEQELQSRWAAGERETIIQKALDQPTLAAPKLTPPRSRRQR
jgi:hypothetical protein